MARRALVVGVSCAALWFALAGEGEARSLRRTLGQPVEHQGGVLAAALAPLGSVIGSQVANQIPTLSTSAGFTYEFNPELEIYERSTQTFGPLFSERAITIGRNKFNVNVSFTHIGFDTYDGQDLDRLRSQVEIAEDANGQRTFAGLRRPDLADRFSGLTQDQIFTQVDVDLDIEAQLFDMSFTYGLLDNLDLNIDIPVIRTFARSTVTELTLDPRFEAVLPPEFDTGPDIVETFAARESAVGIGDIRLRSKYLAFSGPVRVAGLLDLILPTGSPGDFQGAGWTRLGTFLIASGTIGNVLEPHAQAGVETNLDYIDKSQAKYVVGVTAQLGSAAAATVDFIGRSEFGALERVPNSARLPAVENGRFVESTAPFTGRPIFLDIKRNDVLDLAVGGKVAITEQAILFATVTLPLNDDGLRADVVPTAGFEVSF
jgi:hypothetical protein